MAAFPYVIIKRLDLAKALEREQSKDGKSVGPAAPALQ
jgi:hypothetical protein